MKYTYFFLMSAFIPSLSHTMYIENSSTLIIFDIKETQRTHRNHVPLDQRKKPRPKHVQLDQHGIDGINGTYRTGNNNQQKINIKIFSKLSKV